MLCTFAPHPTVTLDIFPQRFFRLFCLMFRSTPSPHSSCSLSSDEDSPKHFGSRRMGTYKIHYQPQRQWDFTTEADDHPVDLSLVLPHYRARSQPAGHQMSMYIRGSEEIKSTIVSAANPG
jgi:hypothetical protein